MARAILKGTSISPGIAIGALHVLSNHGIYDKRQISAEEIDAEIAALNMACEKARRDLRAILHDLPESMKDYREIIGAQLELARDPKILEGARARVKHRKICAAQALGETIDELCSLFHDLADPYLSDRAQDIKALGQRLGNALGGFARPGDKGRKGVLAAPGLSPAEVVELKLNGIQGLLTVEGGTTSHTAILARGMKMPALVGLAALLDEARENEMVIVDGLCGQALLGPDSSELAFYRNRQNLYAAFERDAWAEAANPAITRDGIRISVLANLERLDEIKLFRESGAEGIGLYRTEFAYLGGRLPDEQALVDEYSAIIAGIGSAKVIFRILDVGADKILSFQEALHEPNPALGLRGIRFCLKRKDIFKTQLRAILRAGHNSNAAIMLPMVSAMWEIEAVRALLAEISAELSSQKIAHATSLPLGIMVETPAAALTCDALACKSDFLSIGTNDLLHYLMAIDRDNRHVSYLHEPMHPAFIRSLKNVLKAGREKGIPVSVCGELASDPFGVALLIGLGVNTLSAAPRFVPEIKHIARKLDSRLCAEIAAEALNQPDAGRTRRRLHDLLRQSLGSELSFHNTFISSENGHEQQIFPEYSGSQ